MVDVGGYLFNVEDLPGGLGAAPDLLSPTRGRLAEIATTFLDHCARPGVPSDRWERRALNRVLSLDIEHVEEPHLDAWDRESGGEVPDPEWTPPRVSRWDFDRVLRRTGECCAARRVDDETLYALYRWARLLTSPRYRLVEDLVKRHPEVQLFTPALDRGVGVPGRAPRVSLPRRVELAGKWTRWSRGRVHPLVPFDPCREARLGLDAGLREEDPRSALFWVARALERHGCVGVSLHPSSGFRASEDPDPGVREALHALYAYCDGEDVPIRAHAAPRSGGRRRVEGRAHPRWWRAVLEEYPGLRLCLGGYGGLDLPGEVGVSWAATTTELIESYPGRVFADLAHSRAGLAPLEELGQAQRHALRHLGWDLAEARAFDGVLYGSGYPSILRQRAVDDYPSNLLRAYRELVTGEDARCSRAFAGENALRWLGLEGSATPAARRLFDATSGFYLRHDLPRPPWWSGPFPLPPRSRRETLVVSR